MVSCTEHDVILSDGRLSVKGRNMQGDVLAASRTLDLWRRGAHELTKMENDEK